MIGYKCYIPISLPDKFIDNDGSCLDIVQSDTADIYIIKSPVYENNWETAFSGFSSVLPKRTV